MDEYEEEESLVVVELSGIMGDDFLSKANNCKVLGIDTDNPLLMLDHYVFSGEYQDTLGTCMIFEEKSDQSTGDKNRLEYKDLCTKKLCMHRSFLKRKSDDVEEGSSSQDTPSQGSGTQPSTSTGEEGKPRPTVEDMQQENQLSPRDVEVHPGDQPSCSITDSRHES